LTQHLTSFEQQQWVDWAIWMRCSVPTDILCR
jgi:hypothetical protein